MNKHLKSDQNPTMLKKWTTAIRPFALPASTMPIIFGSAAAVVMGGVRFNVLLFILAFFSMVILHSGANLLSDVNDYRKGLDREPTPVSGAIVRGYITSKTGLIGSVILITFGWSLAMIVIFIVGLPILIIGAIGVIIGIFYTQKPFVLKYRAMGDLAVFLDFGILGTLGAWTVQTGSVSWVPILWAIPMSLLVVAIVHANNWRDIQADEKSKITTVASLLGDRGSSTYYGFLIFGAYGLIPVIIILSRFTALRKTPMPLTFLITFVTLPFAVKLIRQGKSRKVSFKNESFVTLDAGTSLLNLLFGILSTFAIFLHLMIQRMVI
jgi:1,4-dihydroxy-2-naphthoate octaprenyltransferase